MLPIREIQGTNTIDFKAIGNQNLILSFIFNSQTHSQIQVMNVFSGLKCCNPSLFIFNTDYVSLYTLDPIYHSFLIHHIKHPGLVIAFTVIRQLLLSPPQKIKIKTIWNYFN